MSVKYSRIKTNSLTLNKHSLTLLEVLEQYEYNMGMCFIISVQPMREKAISLKY